MITSIIMASGLSKRFGENKLLQTINNKPIFQYTFEAILSSKIDNHIVVTHYDEIIQYCINNKIKYVKNANPHIGQSQSIKLGVENAEKNSHYMFFVADQPLLSKNTIDLIIDKFNSNKNNIIVPVCKDNRGNPKIFPNWSRDNLLTISGDNGGRSVIESNLDKLLELYIDDYKSFLDVDTKEDFDLMTSIILNSWA